MLGDFTEALEGRYMGHDSLWRRQFEEIRNTFNADLGRLKNVDEVRKLFTDTNDTIEQAMDGILRACGGRARRSSRSSGSFRRCHRAPAPTDRFRLSRARSQEESRGEQPRYTYHEEFSLAFWKWVRPFHVQKKKLVGYDTVIDEEKKIQTLKGTLLESFSDGFDEIVRDGGTVETTVRSYLRSVAREGKHLVKQRENEMEAIKERQESNAEMKGRLEALSDQHARFHVLIARVQTAKANL